MYIFLQLGKPQKCGTNKNNNSNGVSRSARNHKNASTFYVVSWMKWTFVVYAAQRQSIFCHFKDSEILIDVIFYNWHSMLWSLIQREKKKYKSTKNWFIYASYGLCCSHCFFSFQCILYDKDYTFHFPGFSVNQR